MGNSKVSIVTPLYNSEKFVGETIASVIAQTYMNWEMLIIDDCSTDSSNLIVEKFIKLDDRIKYFKTTSSSGSPTVPRNMGIKLSSGRYIAFLDSDDLWNPNKLELQVGLFAENDVAIVFSNYEKIDEDGAHSGRIIQAPKAVTYHELLKGNVIACSTAIYDSEKTEKRYFLHQGHEDFALWLAILKKGYVARNCEYVSAKYRVRKSSVSANKIRAIGWVWTIYRKNEGFSMMKSLYYSVITLCKSFLKYIK